MNQNEIKNEILRAFGDWVVREGFSRKPVGQSFFRSFREGIEVLHVSFIPHSQDIDFTLDVAIRFESVERLISNFEKSIGMSPAKKKSTLGVELGNLVERKPRRYTVGRSREVEFMVASAFELFMGVGRPYLTRYSEPISALEVLSGDDSTAWLHSPFHSARAIRAVALANEYVGLGRALIVAKEKLEFLNNMGDEDGIGRLENFMAYISAR